MSSRADLQIEQILETHNAVLVRDRKHLVYRLPGNKTFVMAKSSSDVRASMNNLSDLRRILGVRPDPAVPRERRSHKKRRPSSPPVIFTDSAVAPIPTFRAKLHQVYYGPEMLVIQPREFQAELNYSLRAARSTEPPPEPEHDPRPSPPRKKRQPSERVKPHTVRILPTDVLKQANEILQTQGEPAMRDFLNHHRGDFAEVTSTTARALARVQIEETTVQPPTKIESARQLKTELQNRLNECDDVIRNRQQVKMLTEAQLNEVETYISAYEMLEQQEEKIKDILPAAAVAANTGMGLVNRKGRRDMVGAVLSVFRNHPTAQLAAAAVHAEIKAAHPRFDCTPVEVSQRLTYLSKAGHIHRVSVGVYSLQAAKEVPAAKVATA